MTRTVDFHVSTLREKIEVNARKPRHLLTIRGMGTAWSFRHDDVVAECSLQPSSVS
jgi:DNA-binding response OmpR family regulator